MEKDMAMVNINLLMVINITVNGKKAINKEKVYYNISLERSMMVNGKMI